MTCWHLYRINSQMREDAKEDRLKERAEAHRLIESYRLNAGSL